MRAFIATMRALDHRSEVSIFLSLKVYFINIFCIFKKIVSVRLSAHLSFPIFRSPRDILGLLPCLMYLFIRPSVHLSRVAKLSGEFSFGSYRSDSLPHCPVQQGLFLFQFGRSLLQISD